MLKINNLHVKIGNKKILKGINIEIKSGEIHAIMGPNGSGKSTLSLVIAGKKDYEVTEGEIIFDGINLLELSPEKRAHLGIFLSFQYPVEIPGVSVINFMKIMVNEILKSQGKNSLHAKDLLKKIRDTATLLGIQEDFLSRPLNEGFSGGEKKKNEIFQMAILKPKLAILDETDSGLDIDALKIVANGVNTLKSSKNSILVITHYQRLLNYIIPDFVHVFSEGRIIKTGDKTLAIELEKKGYDWII